ncbi:MAG TPA: DsbA family protein [Xanthobacteraceae bacterium]|nr:DsbA family protein [Xanthobacteraceae bacterium]
MLTRRDFVIGVSAFALAGGAVAGFAAPALADNVSVSDLMQPGPLGDESLGPENAPVTIVEYASMTCPHCAHFSEETFPKLKERYIDTGKVRFIFREFPFDPLAAGAFMLARCAGTGKYFPMIETLFQKQSTWAVQKPLEPLKALAKQAGFTDQSFEACLSNQKVLDGIEWVRNRAADKFKVDSTPTFFINGERHKGDMSIEEMAKLIDPYLKS